MSRFTESIVEDAAIEWFAELGYSYMSGPEIAPDGESPERIGFDSAVLEDRLYNALLEINKTIPSQIIDEAVRTIIRADSPNLILNNRTFHKYVTEGIDVTFFQPLELIFSMVDDTDKRPTQKNRPFRSGFFRFQ